MGTPFDDALKARVIARWAGTPTLVEPLTASTVDVPGPSSARVAELHLAYTEKKTQTPGKVELDMGTFFKEEGTKTVTSPLSGKKVKLTTLKNPTHKEDPKSKDLLNKLFKEWREKKKPKEEKAPEGEKSKEDEAGGEPKPPEVKAPEVKAPEVKAPEVKAPDVVAPVVEEGEVFKFPKKDDDAPKKDEAPKKPKKHRSILDQKAPKKPNEGAPKEEGPKKPKAPEEVLDEAGMQDAADPFRETEKTLTEKTKDLPKSKAPPREEGEDTSKAPDAPAEGGGGEATPQKPKKEVPEPDIEPGEESGQEPVDSSKAPEPDVGDGLSGRTPEDIDRGFSLIRGLMREDLNPSEIKKLQEAEKWWRDLAGEDSKDEKDRKDSPSMDLTGITEEASQLIKKYSLSDDNLKEMKGFADKVQQADQESEKPIESIKVKHSIGKDDEKAIGQITTRARKQRQSEQKKYQKAVKKYEADTTEWEAESKPIEKEHNILRKNLSERGVSEEDFDGIKAFVSSAKDNLQKDLKQWKTDAARAKERGQEPPLKPTLQHAWLRHNKEEWDKNPKNKGKEYKSPEIPEELFDKIQDVEPIPFKPEKPKKPEDMSTSELRESIQDSDPDLAESMKDMSDADFEVMTQPRKSKNVAEMMQDFISNTDDPDLKKRIREMDPDEFEELLAAMNPKKGKRGSLREWTIRLAYTRPDLQELLLPVLTRQDGGW